MTFIQQYRNLWRIPGALRLLVAGTVARLGNGITLLAWLLLLKQTTGSYGLAALVGAASSVATGACAPVGGRLADRFGPVRVLITSAAIYSATQLALLAAVLGRLPVAALCAIAAVSGATFPPIGPALKAAWTVLTSADGGRAEVRTAAMAADSALYELVFVVGPLLLSIFVLLGTPLGRIIGTMAGIAGPAAALAGASVCTGLGTLIVARGRVMRELRPAAARTRGLGPLRDPRLLVLLLCASGVAFAFGAAPVAIAAYTRAHDGGAADSVAGVLIAVWSIGSAITGFWYGTRRMKAGLARQFVVLLVGLAAGYALWALMPNSLALGALLFLTGAVVAPALTVEASLVAEIAQPSMLNESYTWLTTTNLSVTALGSALGGVIVDRPGGPAWGFLAAAAGAGFAAAVAAWPGALSRETARSAVAMPDGVGEGA